MNIETISLIILLIYSAVMTFYFLATYKKNSDFISLRLEKKNKIKPWSDNDWGKLLSNPSENKIP